MQKSSLIDYLDIVYFETETIFQSLVENGEIIFKSYPEIAKLREREGQRVDLGRSLKGHLWMVYGGWWISFP